MIDQFLYWGIVYFKVAIVSTVISVGSVVFSVVMQIKAYRRMTDV